MQLTDFAREVPEDVWARFAPILPPVVWGVAMGVLRMTTGSVCTPPLRAGDGDWVADVAQGVSLLQDGPTAAQGLGRAGRLSAGVATAGPTLRDPAGDQLG